MPSPPLPSSLAQHHRRCLKRGECTCAERLAATLGAADPRLALDRLFERQLKLLMTVRNIWRRGETARGALPFVPPMAPPPAALPLPVPSLRPQYTRSVGFADFRDDMVRDGERGGKQGDSSAPDAAAIADYEAGVGMYHHGGVLAGFDEGGAMGPTGHCLPERLADLL